jgi:hypothetical protein
MDLSKAGRLQDVARHLEVQHRRIELARGHCETRLRRVRIRQDVVADALGQVAQSQCPDEHAGAWAVWRAAHVSRLASEDQALEAQRQRLVRKLAAHTRRLARSTGRRRAMERLVAVARTAQQRRTDSLQQAELDQRAGLRSTGSDGLK